VTFPTALLASCVAEAVPSVTAFQDPAAISAVWSLTMVLTMATADNVALLRTLLDDGVARAPQYSFVIAPTRSVKKALAAPFDTLLTINDAPGIADALEVSKGR
jgi:hypothetical protein